MYESLHQKLAKRNRKQRLSNNDMYRFFFHITFNND